MRGYRVAWETPMGTQGHALHVLHSLFFQAVLGFMCPEQRRRRTTRRDENSKSRTEWVCCWGNQLHSWVDLCTYLHEKGGNTPPAPSGKRCDLTFRRKKGRQPSGGLSGLPVLQEAGGQALGSGWLKCLLVSRSRGPCGGIRWGKKLSVDPIQIDITNMT